MGRIFNSFCEHLIWHNYGNAVFTILGRDIACFMVGYIARIIVDCIVTYFVDKWKERKK